MGRLFEDDYSQSGAWGWELLIGGAVALWVCVKLLGLVIEATQETADARSRRRGVDTLLALFGGALFWVAAFLAITGRISTWWMLASIVPMVVPSLIEGYVRNRRRGHNAPSN